MPRQECDNWRRKPVWEVKLWWEAYWIYYSDCRIRAPNLQRGLCPHDRKRRIENQGFAARSAFPIVYRRARCRLQIGSTLGSRRAQAEGIIDCSPCYSCDFEGQRNWRVAPRSAQCPGTQQHISQGEWRHAGSFVLAFGKSDETSSRMVTFPH